MEGINVYAKDPADGIYGPICDQSWDFNDVSYFYLFLTTLLHFYYTNCIVNPKKLVYYQTLILM